MVVDYKIPMIVYEKLMFSILEEYADKFKIFASVATHVVEKRYTLPTIRKTTLRMGGVSVYITKPPEDLFDIEYTVVYRLNAKQFIKFVNEYMHENGNMKFDLAKYKYIDEFLYSLSEYMYNRYKIKSTIYVNGGYIQFDVKVFMHPDTRIINIE